MQTRLLGWSLRHRRARHVLNAITIAITAAVVIVFASVLSELISYVRASRSHELTRVIIMPKMGEQLPAAMYETLKRIDGVQIVLRYRAFGGRHPSGARYIVVGEEDGALDLTQDIFPVEPAVADAWKKERLGAIVTEETARELRLKVGDESEIPTSIGPLKIKVVGLSHGATIANRIVVHYEYIRDLGAGAGTAQYRVFAKPDDFERVARTIDESTQNSAAPVLAVSGDSTRASAARRASTVPAVLGFLGLLLVVTTALTLANSAAISIRKRRMEIATMRVLGYHRRSLLVMLVTEALLVGLVGGIVAVAVTWFAFRGGVQLAPSSSQVLKPVEVGAVGIAAGLAIALLVPLAGVLPAAMSTLRMPLGTALRDSA